MPDHEGPRERILDCSAICRVVDNWQNVLLTDNMRGQFSSLWVTQTAVHAHPELFRVAARVEGH